VSSSVMNGKIMSYYMQEGEGNWFRIIDGWHEIG
jgi:hypothetical protein